MATAFSSLRGRLLALLLLSLWLFLLPLAWLSVREAERAAGEDLQRALFTRLYLLREESFPESEALLLELFRLVQLFGGGVGFVVQGEEARFTQVEAWPLPQELFQALKEGRPYQGVWRGSLYVACPAGGFPSGWRCLWRGFPPWDGGFSSFTPPGAGGFSSWSSSSPPGASPWPCGLWGAWRGF